MIENQNEFIQLKHFVEQNLKIFCSNYKEDYIKRRFFSRMRSTNTNSYAEYLHYVKTNPPEMELLRKALTINVTEFFRDKEVFDAIKTVILPAIIKERKRISIWCAGSSTGEEPYSLAIILYELIATHKDISGYIIATDIDQVVLGKAKAGVFEDKLIKKLPISVVQKHFTQLPNGSYEAKQHLKDLIRFRPHDLMSDIPPARFLDLITCRNVTIYFNEKQKDDLARMFHSALVANGFYVMGKTEYLGRQVENLFTPFNSLLKIFVKKS
jgi:chemotaxis protein methyltransferase CheR